jgi:hypothetical protein
MNVEDILGTWQVNGIRFSRNGVEAGFWAEQGLWIFDKSGHFAFGQHYTGGDANFPKELAPSLQCVGKFQLSGDRMITKTISSSQEKRINEEQHYKIMLESGILKIQRDSSEGDFSLTVECFKA